MRTNFVDKSVVSAITQTPASGPLALVTIPPISSLSILGGADAAARTRVNELVSNIVRPKASTTPYRTLFVFILANSPSDSATLGFHLSDPASNLRTLCQLRSAVKCLQ